MKQSKAGQTVTIEGKALDAKAGAVVVQDDGSPVYVDGLDSWPSAVHGKRVRATGLLVEEKRIPDPGTNPITAGAFGTQMVLKQASWSELSP